MLKRAISRAAAVAMIAAWGGGSARADFVIDDFTVPNPTPGFVMVPTLGVATLSSPLPGGVTRNLTVTETANVGGETRYRVGTVPVLGGRLTLSTVDTTANIQAAYTYTTGQNLSAAGTSLQFTFATADFGVPYSVRLGDGTNTATQIGTTNSGAGVYSFSTGSFAGVNLGAITSVVLSLNRNLSTGAGDVTSADFSLTDVRVLTPTSPPPPVVPAPPAAVLALAAVPLLGLARVRRLLPVPV